MVDTPLSILTLCDKKLTKAPCLRNLIPQGMILEENVNGLASFTYVPFGAVLAFFHNVVKKHKCEILFPNKRILVL